MTWVLVLLLIISLAGNAYQAHRWRVYRDKPGGSHSYTNVMPKVTRMQVNKDVVSLISEGKTAKQ